MILYIIFIISIFIIIRQLYRCPNKKTVFVSGYYHTGTNWIRRLIQQNTHKVVIHNNAHKFIVNGKEIHQRKHGKLSDAILNEDSVIIIYMIRDFDSWLKSFKNNQYEVKLKDDIVVNENDESSDIINYGWPSGMNVYDLYCHIIETNVELLRNSKSKYIICNLNYAQKDKGREIINILKEANIDTNKYFSPIDQHTKSAQKYSQNREYEDIDITYYRKEENEYIKNIPNIEYRI